MSLAVKAGAAAAPCASVPAVTAFVPVLAKVPLALLPGASNSTGIPAGVPVNGQPLVFVSATCRFVWNIVSSCAVWRLPPTTISSFGGLVVGQAPAALAEPKPAARTAATTASVSRSRLGRIRSASLRPRVGSRAGWVARVGDDPAVQERDLAGAAGGNLALVRDHHDRGPLGVELVEEREDLLAG